MVHFSVFVMIAKFNTMIYMQHSDTTKDVKNLEAVENEFFEDTSYEVIPPKDVFVYNELRSCADLVRLVNEETLDIKPDFQRNIVWSNSQQTEFIDSLVKQLPIPSLCFSLDPSSQKRLVIDGLQRISTITKFLNEKDWRLAKSEGISRDLTGKTVREIEKENQTLYKLVQNTTIPVTIVHCDSNRPEHMEYLFMIFHRLNKSGTKLYNQEIRNCIYSGNFNVLLRDLSKNPLWKKVYRITEKKIDRMRDEELVLRFFAFSEKWESYDGHLTRFLNEYMSKKRNLSDDDVLKKEKIFLEVTDTINTLLPNELYKNEGITVKEALFIGVFKNLSYLKGITSDQMQKIYCNFRSNSAFSESSIQEGLMRKAKVLERMQAAIDAFSFEKNEQ